MRDLCEEPERQAQQLQVQKQLHSTAPTPAAEQHIQQLEAHQQRLLIKLSNTAELHAQQLQIQVRPAFPCQHKPGNTAAAEPGA